MLNKDLLKLCNRLKKMNICDKNCPILKDNKCPELKPSNNEAVDMLSKMFGMKK